MTTRNDQLVLVTGFTSTGKSACLKDLKNQDSVWYGNTEANKRLPFKSNFAKEFNITNVATQIPQIFAKAEEKPEIKTIIIDSLTFMMNQFEAQVVTPAADGRAAWGQYASFFKNLMLNTVATSTKTVIFTAHNSVIMNEADMVREVLVKVKGSLMNEGIEAYFSTIISTKRMTIEELEPYENDMLTITDDEKLDGFKYVFQTRTTAETMNERIRSPMGLWDRHETFIDNNIQLVMDKLEKYYN